ncbi:recombinase family protein [Pontibacter beigongshangensis]|uniref:recombinase family protein n=1 Tax=Pontibacter beigongshangensis TaxID=2574733 RepID=UPI00164F38B0|nr:recombinase family protein [Pontibacter beigongshangensis]
MRIGYARVSTQDQKLELQTDALSKYGCLQLFKEKKSGKNKERPELERMISQLRAGDTVVVWKLDRLGRSLRDLIDLVAEFQERGVDFVSLQDGINTATATGRFTFNIFASLAEFEREIIRERTKAGLDAAKARGRKGGRPAGLSKEAQGKAKSAKILFDSKTKTVEEIAKILGIGRATCYRYIDHASGERLTAPESGSLSPEEEQS